VGRGKRPTPAHAGLSGERLGPAAPVRHPCRPTPFPGRRPGCPLPSSLEYYSRFFRPVMLGMIDAPASGQQRVSHGNPAARVTAPSSRRRGPGSTPPRAAGAVNRVLQGPLSSSSRRSAIDRVRLGRDRPAGRDELRAGGCTTSPPREHILLETLAWRRGTRKTRRRRAVLPRDCEPVAPARAVHRLVPAVRPRRPPPWILWTEAWARAPRTTREMSGFLDELMRPWYERSRRDRAARRAGGHVRAFRYRPATSRSAFLRAARRASR